MALPIHTSSAEDVFLLWVDVDGLNLPAVKVPHLGSLTLCPCVHQEGLSVGAGCQQPGGGGAQTHVGQAYVTLGVVAIHL